MQVLSKVRATKRSTSKHIFGSILGGNVLFSVDFVVYKNMKQLIFPQNCTVCNMKIVY